MAVKGFLNFHRTEGEIAIPCELAERRTTRDWAAHIVKVPREVAFAELAWRRTLPLGSSARLAFPIFGIVRDTELQLCFMQHVGGRADR
jgi:hypothetical protein